MQDQILAAPPKAPSAQEVIARLRGLLHETQRLAALQAQEIAVLKGERHTGIPGSHIARVICGDAYIQVEYDHQPAEDAVHDVESPVCGPGCDEAINPISIYLNGHWCDLEDVRAALDQDKLIEAIAVARGGA